jgi:acyl-[acyl-carrier-protein]-phospholipid O-acyltransferase/long-chain-fatty-acid--[acyl-carrier-protein] ligase
MPSPLISTRRFLPLFLCQFFSALNDNFLKQALIILVTFELAASSAGWLNQLAGAVFIAPAFFLSAVGGQLADRYDKAFIARRLKMAGVGAAVIAIIGFAFRSLEILFGALFLFGIISALFGPIKYGILPDHLKREELPSGNALVEAATFIAVLLGTIFGGLVAMHGGHSAIFGVMVIVVALAGLTSSRFIPSTGEGAPTLAVDPNIIRSTAQLLKYLWADDRIRRCSLMVVWFWTIGLVVVQLLPTLIKDTFGGSEGLVTVYFAIFSVGIGIGSGLVSWLASGRIILLPTPIAAILMGFFALDVGFAGTFGGASAQAGSGSLSTALSIRLGMDFLGLAVAGGLYIVPAFSAVQAWSEAASRARVIAAVNVLAALFMVIGAITVGVLETWGMTPAGVFLLLAGGNFLVGLAIFRFLPTSPRADFLSILFRAFYRLEVKGAENLKTGRANTIVALNHVSFLDAALALSLLERDPLFAIDRGIAERWWVKPFRRLTRTISLDPTKPMGTRTLINAVKNGETLIIFPEGRLTVTGSLMKVYDGSALIADKTDALIVPVRIDGLEQTFFTRLTREQVRHRWWPKVTVTVLEPVKLKVDPALQGKRRRQAAGAMLYQIMSDLVFRTTPIDRTVFGAVAEAATRHGPRRIAIEDPVAGSMSYQRLLAASAVLGQKLMSLAGEGEALGVMLPNSNGVALTILGLFSAGRVPAMINFSAGAANIVSACAASKVTTIVTSRTFIEKSRLRNVVAAIESKLSLVYLEDIFASIGRLDRLRGMIRSWRPLVNRRPDDPAVILFTSGTEGAPKGVVLSHRNILANAAQASARIDFGRADKVFDVLPVFHSFGFTVGFILPLTFGVRVYLYPSPLHYRLVPELIYGVNATILLGTDTFLTGYARMAHPYDFRSLRYILAGAEPLKDSTRRVFMEKFGLRILEGYGVTETAPALALNTPMFNRYGTVGRLLPGIDMRLERVPGLEEGGRLFVRGPNVMLGYLRAEKPGVLEAPTEGWYDTGDIVTIDADGFITIKGRAKRFAKVGGEMISLAAVEALASELWPTSISAVTSVADPRKGERLILVTDKRGASRGDFLARAKARSLAELMIPSDIFVVDKIPLLGSGKPDNLAVKKLVAERLSDADRVLPMSGMKS